VLEGRLLWRTPLVTLSPAVFAVRGGWRNALGEIPGGRAWGEEAGGLLFRGYSGEQMCSIGREIFIGLGVWVTPLVTLVGVPVASVQETLNVHYNYLQDE
jgi:hypothetical protein